MFSPSDLMVFLDSPFASWMERAKIENPDFSIIQDAPDQLMSLLVQKAMNMKMIILNN